jgi:hypothetical protein
MPNDLTPKLDTIRAQELIDLAHQHFSDGLFEAEKKVLSDSAGSGFPDGPGEGSNQPLVRAQFLRWLMSDDSARRYIDPRGIRVWGATIADELNIGDCSIPFPLDFRGCIFQKAFSLVAAETRQMTLVQCKTIAGIKADRLIVHGALFLRGIESFEEIRLQGARISGHFECSGSNISTSARAMSLDGAIIEGNVHFRPFPGAIPPKPFISTGSICMNGAIIRGDLDLTAAILCLQTDNSEKSALCLDRIKVDGSLDLASGFTANREIRAVDASIGSSLQCRGAHLADIGSALNVNRIRVGGSVFFDSGFQAAGDINLSNAQIAHDLNFNGARVGRVICEDLKLSGDLIWVNVADETNVQRYLNLSGASIKNLIDDDVSWPIKGNLVLDGLGYRDIDARKRAKAVQGSIVSLPESLPLDIEKRVQWLMLQDGQNQLMPQPWLQFAKLQKDKGRDDNAKHIIYRFRCVQAASGKPLFRPFSVIFAALEEKPSWILVPILCCVFFGSLLYWHGGRMRAMAPTSNDAYVKWTQGQLASGAYPKFSGITYTIENALPIFRLGQNDTWAPDPHYNPVNWFPTHPCFSWTAWLSSYTFLSGLRVVLNVLGWFQAIVLGFALTSRFKS